MAWCDKKEVKKGDYGELLIDEYYWNFGYMPYVPNKEGAHTIDRMYCKKKTSDVFIADIKTKPYRNVYPDTGLNTSHYNEYIRASLNLGVDVKLIFVDEKLGQIYGNSIKELIKTREFGIKTYPWEHGNQTYFLVDSMIVIRDLTENEIAKLKSY